MITQRLARGGGGCVGCPGCHSSLADGVLQHPDDCPELQRGNTAGPLPTPAQIRVWLTAHGWTRVGAGEGGSAWLPEDGRDWVGIPDDSGTWEMGGALERIAKRSGVLFGDMVREMLA